MPLHSPTTPLVGYGLAIGLETLEGFQFDPHRPYSGCRICGELFQSEYDRNPESAEQSLRITADEVQLYTLEVRRQWSLDHAKTHPASAHHQLKLSGRWCTPEAAQKLAAFGVVSILDLALDDEVSHALEESSPIPKDDVEGTRY